AINTYLNNITNFPLVYSVENYKEGKALLDHLRTSSPDYVIDARQKTNGKGMHIYIIDVDPNKLISRANMNPVTVKDTIPESYQELKQRYIELRQVYEKMRLDRQDQ